MKLSTALPAEVLGRTDVQHAIKTHNFGQLFHLARKWAGFSHNKIGEACDIKPSRMSEIARGQGSITTLAKIEQIADSFRIPGHMLRLAPRTWEMTTEKAVNRSSGATAHQLPVLNGARGDVYTEEIRETSRKLVALDNELNGLPIAAMAARSFKKVHRRLGSGDYSSNHERDIQAAAAELAEVAGWALFNEGKFGASRRFSQEALFLAKLSGDRSIELVTLQNMGMLAGWVGRPQEELAIAQSVIDLGNLTPRVEAMFRAREAQGLAGLGHSSEAARSFNRARSLLQDSSPADEPSWAWWVTEREIDRQQGRILHETGVWNAAIPILERAMQSQNGSHVGYENVASVRLLDSLIEVKAWKAAEREAENLTPAIGEMSSVVTLKLLDRVVGKGKGLPDIPGDLHDALHQIEVGINEDPYEI